MTLNLKLVSLGLVLGVGDLVCHLTDLALQLRDLLVLVVDVSDVVAQLGLADRCLPLLLLSSFSGGPFPLFSEPGGLLLVLLGQLPFLLDDLHLSDSPGFLLGSLDLGRRRAYTDLRRAVDTDGLGWGVGDLDELGLYGWEFECLVGGDLDDGDEGGGGRGCGWDGGG